METIKKIWGGIMSAVRWVAVKPAQIVAVGGGLVAAVGAGVGYVGLWLEEYGEISLRKAEQNSLASKERYFKFAMKRAEDNGDEERVEQLKKELAKVTGNGGVKTLAKKIVAWTIRATGWILCIAAIGLILTGVLTFGVGATVWYLVHTLFGFLIPNVEKKSAWQKKVPSFIKDEAKGTVFEKVLRTPGKVVDVKGESVNPLAPEMAMG